MHKDTVTVGPAAELLGVHRNRVLRLIQSGEIKTVRESTGPHDPNIIAIEELVRYQKEREAKIAAAPINKMAPALAGTVSTSPADGAGQAVAKTTSGSAAT